MEQPLNCHKRKANKIVGMEEIPNALWLTGECGGSLRQKDCSLSIIFGYLCAAPRNLWNKAFLQQPWTCFNSHHRPVCPGVLKYRIIVATLSVPARISHISAKLANRKQTEMTSFKANAVAVIFVTGTKIEVITVFKEP